MLYVTETLATKIDAPVLFAAAPSAAVSTDAFAALTAAETSAAFSASGASAAALSESALWSGAIVTLSTTLPAVALSSIHESGTPYSAASSSRTAVSLNVSPRSWSRVMAAVTLHASCSFVTASEMVWSCAPPSIMCGMEPPYCSSAAAPGQKSTLDVHSIGSAEPAGAQKPGTTGRQPVESVSPVTLEVVPAAQKTGAGLPSKQYDPTEQSLHAVRPLSSWYSPAEQAEHEPLPGPATRPGLHSKRAWPPGQKLPAGQAEHWAWL